MDEGGNMGGDDTWANQVIVFEHEVSLVVTKYYRVTVSAALTLKGLSRPSNPGFLGCGNLVSSSSDRLSDD
jgi:hypothetical protein